MNIKTALLIVQGISALCSFAAAILGTENNKKEMSKEVSKQIDERLGANSESDEEKEEEP